jgi:threonine dehydrogenase-like Zn-dependent dehydrogenase
LFQYPWDAGYCNVGVVLEVGKAVTRLKPGDRVASTGPHGSTVVVTEEECVAIPSAVSDDEAVFSSIAQIVMQGVRLANLSLGENAVVCGLGLLGQMATVLARYVGCWPVIGVDLEPFRRQMALKMGATAVTGPNSAEELIRRHSEDRMADVVFEVTGNPKAIPVALGWTRKMGRFVMVSSPTGPTTVDFHDLVNAHGTVIIGAHSFTHPSVPNEYNRWTRRADARLYLSLAEAGLLKVDSLITQRFPSRRAPEAYQQLLNGRASSLAVILEWNEG